MGRSRSRGWHFAAEGEIEQRVDASIQPNDSNGVPLSRESRLSKMPTASCLYFPLAASDLPVAPMSSHEIEIRVRYNETDAQGVVHHANYANYFEVGRIEMLRAKGISYREFEERDGLMLVVSQLSCEYFLPARYDDHLRLVTTTVKAKGARIVHRYELSRGEDLIARGETTIACVSKAGRVTRLPESLRGK